MYCRNCGRRLDGDFEYCDECDKRLHEVKEDENVQVIQEVGKKEEKKESAINPEAKSKVAAGIFGLLLGSFGVHNFYLGYNGKAIAQLLITILSCGILSPVSALWGFIEGILILTGSIDSDANGVKLKE